MNQGVQEEITAFMLDVSTLADQIVEHFTADHPIGKLAREVQAGVKHYHSEVEQEGLSIHIGQFQNLVVLSFSAPISYILLNEEQVGHIVTGLTESLLAASTYERSADEPLH